MTYIDRVLRGGRFDRFRQRKLRFRTYRTVSTGGLDAEDLTRRGSANFCVSGYTNIDIFGGRTPAPGTCPIG